MTDVPHQPVAGGVEDGVQRDRQLDHPKPGSDVAAGARSDLDEPGAQLFGNGAQLIARHRLEVRGRLDTVEN